MENDPSLDGKYLGTITEDFVKISDILKEAAEQLRIRKISDYPIFTISKSEAPVGELLFKAEEKDLNWNFYFGYLELFTEQELVLKEKLQDFLSTYKSPEEYACLFVWDKDFTKFIYIPFPEDDL